MSATRFTLTILPDGSLAGNVPGCPSGASWGAVLVAGGPSGVLRHFMPRGSHGSICRADASLAPFAPVQFGRKGAGSSCGVVVARSETALDVQTCAGPREALEEAARRGWTPPPSAEPTPWKGRGRRGRRRAPESRESWVTPPASLQVPNPAPGFAAPPCVVALLDAVRDAAEALRMSGCAADAEALEAARDAVRAFIDSHTS